jgi:energy-coupling factor transporter ATP-binding protein EcfA2
MTTQRPPRLPELARSVAEVANGVVAAARAVGREDLAAALIEISTRWSEPEVTVSVVGATGTGKTTLVNALIGSAVVAIDDRDRLHAPVTLVRSGPRAVIQVQHADSGEVVELASLADLPEAPVDSLTVTVTDSLLDPRLTVIDTRGGLSLAGPVDGLAAAMAARSDLVLVTTAASAPVDEPTLTTVDALLDSTPNVLVVLTGIDRHRGWRQIAADDAGILRERHGERAPELLPVSPQLALTAAALRAQGDPEADAVERESGIPDLRLRLDALVSRSRWARLRNLSHFAGRVADELAGEASTAEPSDTPADQLTETTERIAAYRQRSSELPLALGDECNRLREALVVDVRRVSSDAMTGYEGRITSGRPHDEALQQLSDELRAGQVELATVLDRRVETLTGWIMDRLDGSDTALDAPFVPRDTRPAVPASKRDMSLALRMAAAIAAGGGGLALLGTLALAGGMSGEVRLGLLGFSSMSGSFGTLLSLRHSRGQREGTLGRLEARAVVDDWQALLAAELRSKLLDAQRRLEAALRSALTERIGELEERAAVLRGAAAQPQPVRADAEQLGAWREQLRGFESVSAEAMAGARVGG